MNRSVAFILSVLLFPAGNLFAQEKAKSDHNQSIAVIDISKIEDQSDAMKTIHSQANELIEKYKKEVSDLEYSIRRERDKLNEEKKKLKTQEVEVREHLFVEKENQLRQLFRKRKYQWDKALDSAREEFKKVVLSTISDIAKKNGYTYVLDKKAALYSEESFDITDQVLKDLNAKIKKIDVVPQEVGKGE